ncbi:U3 small nucleolar RNA-associated protein NOL7 [Petaurus breviceps papuanus]|uniref:U3 small nucleolar RNA-associated protein NOL7 n=1 Tax=Petaurus breviceps papuanus TaxID=3040969 RepID=UPI0036DBE47B
MVNLRPRRQCRTQSAETVLDQGDEKEDSEELDSEEEEPDLEFPDGGPAAETMEEDDDDDEAPEEVTFASAQAEAEEDKRRLRDALRRDKTLLKEKRKRREELFTEQKKRKLLPATLLEELTAAPQIKINESLPRLEKGNMESENKGKKEQTFPIRVKKRYVACRLKDQDLIDLRQQAAKGFIQKYLYGRGSNRTTVNKFLSLDNKRLPVKKPAVQFVNNSWGTERKQSANKFKQQWMHKKKLASRRPNIT